MSHLCHFHFTLSQGGEERAWLLLNLHYNLGGCLTPVEHTEVQPSHLVKTVQQVPTHLRLCDASIIGVGVVWVNPYRTGTRIFWRHPWPVYITDILVSETNPGGTNTKSNPKISALVLHQAVLLSVTPKSSISAP